MTKWIVMGIGMILVLIDFIEVRKERRDRKIELKEIDNDNIITYKRY